MNAKQESKLNMYRATQKHCADNSAIVKTLPALQTIFNTLNVKLSALISLAQQEDVQVKGIAVDKSEAKKTLSRLATDIAAPIFALASATGDNKLKQEVNFTFSDLLKTKDDVLAPRCQNIKDIAASNLVALTPYGITASGLAALQTEIDNYQVKVPEPRNSAAQKKTIRENIKNLFTEIDTVLKEQMDKTVLGLKATQPDFVSTYKANRVIIDPGKSTTSLKGLVQNEKDLKPIAKASIVIEETAYKTVTGIAGRYQLKPAPVGKFTVTFSAAGYAEKIETVTIKQGQNTVLDVLLNTV